MTTIFQIWGLSPLGDFTKDFGSLTSSDAAIGVADERGECIVQQYDEDDEENITVRTIYVTDDCIEFYRNTFNKKFQNAS